MMKLNKTLNGMLAVVSLTASASVFAHGDVSPQPVDTTGLDALGEEWLLENPYRGNETAIKIGSSAYNANCARCHGLEAVSGGIAPDLRELSNTDDDEYFIGRARNGAIRNGVTYMPKFEGILSQEAIWAIRSYLVSVSIETLEAAEAAGEEKPAEASAKPEPEAKPSTEAKPAGEETQPAADKTSALEPAEKKKLLMPS